MAQNTDLNVSPYYDDYDETKDFHRILFRPANAIQARELTQLQSILQNQTEKFGNHIFKEGSLVMGGTITVNKEYYAVKMIDGNPNGSGETAAETYRAAAVGKYYRGKVSLVVGKCINTAAATTDGDPLTLFFNIVQSGNPTGNTFFSTFADNEDIEEVALSADGTYSNTSNSNNEFRAIVSLATFTGSAATVRSGVFYTRGFFVRCAAQTILLDKYSNTPTYRVGLQIEETLISSADDDSLDDNATGTSNENAPGANRLKIALTFTKKAIGGTQDVDNFIELSRIEAGIITKQKDITAYNVLERTLARRTSDESGDYVIKPYQLQLRQHLNSRTNNGVYLSTNTVTPGDKTKFVGVISPGKAYVKGFEVDKPSQNLVTFSKARTTEDAGALAVPFEIGNYYHVRNVFGQPDFGTADPDITPFGPVELHDTVTTTPGTEAGDIIGRARVRYFNCTTPDIHADNYHTADSIHRLYLFDVRMFTKIVVETHGSYALTDGQRVKGTVSGAKGTVAGDGSTANVAASGTTVMLMDVEGTFSTSDVIRLENATSGGKTIGTGSIRQYSTDRVRQIYQTYSATAGAGSKVNGAANFTCDPVTTDNQFTITGTVKATGTALTGVNSTFTQELKEGDVIVAPSGEPEVVASITSDTAAVISSIGTASEGKFIRQRAQLQEQEKTVAIAAAPKDFISSLTPNSMIIRKQATETLDGLGAGTINGVSGEVLTAEPTTNAGDYSITIMEDNTAEDANEGKLIDITEHESVLATAAGSAGAISLSSTNSTAMDVSDQVKVIYAASKDVSSAVSAKLMRRARGIAVTTPASTGAQSTIYGTNYDDEIITLGVPDVYALRAVFESNDTTPAIPNKLTLAPNFGSCKPGEKLTGSVTGAVGIVIEHLNNDIYFYYISKANFSDGTLPVGAPIAADTITNEHNTNTTTNSRVCTAVTLDSKDVSQNFLLDTGQRDGYYGLASLKRRAGAPTPSNPLVIIVDYFTSGGGSFHSVDSYSGTADSGGPILQYENIPQYKANIFDPLGLEADGEFELTDAIDFRSYVHSLHDPSDPFDVSVVGISAADVSSITVQPFNYTSEEFTSARAVTFDLPQSETSMSTTAMSHYLPRIDKISLSSGGQFIVSTGEPADHPVGPTTPVNSILLHTLFIPPFTLSLSRISVRSQNHKRYTMKDIGRIQGRVKNLERVTSFNALEQATNSHDIKDADGLDRFKSGFVTDNFRGHRTGNVFHPDYKIAVNTETGTLRPMHYSRFVDLSLNTNKSTGYVKTGDLITLPFTETPYITIDKAVTTEYVNPYNVVIFNGTVTLAPSKDMWFDTNRSFGVKREVMGNWDAVRAGIGNAFGTVWNSWTSEWLGRDVTIVSTDITTGAFMGQDWGDDAGSQNDENQNCWGNDPTSCQDPP